MSGQGPNPSDDSPVYHFILKVAILLAFLSIVALAVDSFNHPNAEHQPAPWSCSMRPVTADSDSF